MEFAASIKEINRRKKAFLSLLISIFIGVFFASFLFSYQINTSGYLFVVAMFFLFYCLTLWFLVSISKIRLYVDDKKIEKIEGKNSQIINLSEIRRIKVKRRTSGIIREIYIRSQDKKSMILTALEEGFESIFNILRDKSGAAASIKEIKEPIDFDHLLFYPVLGLSIGLSSIGFFELIVAASIPAIKIILSAFSIYLFVLSVYFFIKKPISDRGVGKNRIPDYLMGAIMFCCALFMIFVSLG